MCACSFPHVFLGKEFTSKKVRDLLAHHGILLKLTNDSETKNAIAERMIRTLKLRLAKYMNERGTSNWIDVLPSIVSAINRTVNRTTSMRPIDVTMSNWKELHARLFPKVEPQNRTSIVPGDHVRIAIEKLPFSRGFRLQFTDEIFKVVKVLPTNPTTYKLTDLKGEEILGRFYYENLSKTSKELIYRIEKVLKRRVYRGKRQVYVKFVGFNSSQNCWLNEDDFVN